jgi:hypothetical protein
VLRLSGTTKSLTGGTLAEGRTSSATYIDTDGLLKTAAANVPVWENGGLRHEGASTNLLLQSENLGTTWTQYFTTVSLDAIASPDGATSAEKIIETIDNNLHGIYQNVNPNGAYSISGHFRSSERRYVGYRIQKTTNDYATTVFDSLNGVVSQSTVVGVTITNVSSSVKPAVNSFYRCITKFTKPIAAFNIFVHLHTTGTPTLNTNGGETYVGDITKGLYMWGFQFESGDATSYIPTTTAAVTRATCALSVPLVLNQNFFQKSAIVMRVRAKHANSATAKSWLTPSTTAEGLIDNGSGALTFKDSAANTATANLTSWAADTIILVAIVTDNATGLMSLSASKDNGVTWIDSADTAFAGLTVGANWLLFSANTQVFECLGWNVIKSNKGFAQMKTYAKANALRLTQ